MAINHDYVMDPAAVKTLDTESRVSFLGWLHASHTILHLSRVILSCLYRERIMGRVLSPNPEPCPMCLFLQLV